MSKAHIKVKNVRTNLHFTSKSHHTLKVSQVVTQMIFSCLILVQLRLCLFRKSMKNHRKTALALTLLKMSPKRLMNKNILEETSTIEASIFLKQRLTMVSTDTCFIRVSSAQIDIIFLDLFKLCQALILK